ncbi:hypothetical protein [Nissabacter sp. SGAir0207]|uniref:hypothetical protein n=1 Tax=Nissabacter sp. SGAir0207 TaxID=2126321 RepID=UPI0010F873A8|nr:hypothetical protein [Nissabacter sp. SGAir0207]
MNQPKKWVFTELVQDADNPEQLIAYAIYKADKDELAKKCRQRNKSEDDIGIELERFHDNLADSDRRLAEYKRRANQVVEGLVRGVDSRVRAELEARENAHIRHLEQQLISVQNELTRAEETALKKWTEQAHNYSAHLNKPPTWKAVAKWIGLWLISGIPGLFATVITTIILVGLVSLFTTNALQSTKEALKASLDVLMVDHGGVPTGNINDSDSVLNEKKNQ